MTRRHTIEFGRGATYRNTRYTVYAHGVYPRGSVLAGHPSRTWLADFPTLEAAQAAYPDAEDWTGGSSYIPIETQVAHLPGDDDPDPFGDYDPSDY